MTVTVEVAANIVVFEVSGDLTAEEAIAAIKSHFSVAPTKLALWDLRNATLAYVRAEDFSTIIDKSIGYLDVRGEHARTAVVVANDWNEMLVKAIEARARVVRDGFEMRIFRKKHAAIAWLNGQE